MMAAVRIVLASASPRRAELLRAAGLQFEIVAADIDETPRPGESPAVYVRRLAIEKAARGFAIVASRSVVAGDQPRHQDPADFAHEASNDLVVLGADTTVVVDGHLLEKPRDADDADRMLRLLSGRRHHVLTGVSLRCDRTEVGGVETTAVDFARLGDADRDWYVSTGEGTGKAGGYAIQGLASRFVRRIEGSYSNVVGLPVALIVEFMRDLASAR